MIIFDAQLGEVEAFYPYAISRRSGLLIARFMYCSFCDNTNQRVFWVPILLQSIAEQMVGSCPFCQGELALITRDPEEFLPPLED